MPPENKMRFLVLFGLIATACTANTNAGERNGPGDDESGLGKQPGGSCYVGGCSGQLCGDDSQNLISTCEWREAYGCYQGAVCERQADGRCGWTVTTTLASCLNAKGERCGGFAGTSCTAGSGCIDDPNDDCQPSTGADCGGVCVIGR
jgi:hypothetical protein